MIEAVKVFLERLGRGERIEFKETIGLIDACYDYQPIRFRNGLGARCVVSEAGTNEGSLKIFSFAQLHGLEPLDTLKLFGHFYHEDVLNDPDGSGHPNIRNFMESGWEGIVFEGVALMPKA
jgi:hypothetical protein